MTTAFILKLICIVLQYGMLFCLLIFVGKMAKKIFGDVRKELKKQHAPETKESEARLCVIADESDKLLGHRFAFIERITIGRGDDNDICVSENFVSYHHAVIYRHGNQYVIEDLGSRNHTYVDNIKLNGRRYLKTGDLIRIGLLTLKFER